MTFNPKMMVLAREAAGLTQSALALDAGVSQALISKIENGLDEPTAETLAAVAARCDVPVAFFEQQEAVLGEGVVDIFHRKRATLPAKPLRRANALANVVRFEALRALRSIELEDVTPFPFYPVNEYDSIEEIATLVRATWRVPMGPLPNLVALIEATGSPVFRLPLGHEKLSAVSMPGENGRPVIVLNSELPASAQRFSLAHELGHLVMHDGAATSDMERDADAFASALLMPADGVRKFLKGIRFRDLGPMKQVWRVSLAALIRRAHDLGQITDSHYRLLNIQLSQLPGGRKREPGEFEPEEPRLMRYVLTHYERDLSYSTDDIARLVVANVGQVKERYFGETARSLRAVGSDRPTRKLSISSN